MLSLDVRRNDHLTFDVTSLALYSVSMIISFSCKETEKIYTGSSSRRWRDIRNVVERKLQLLDSAATLDALRSPPGNRLEALSGNRAG